MVVLDPTAGGGSIPFEALRLGHRVIANELNPVAATILYATLDYPARFGQALIAEIGHWGDRLVRTVEDATAPFVAFSELPPQEREHLGRQLQNCPDVLPAFDVPEHDHIGQLFCRQVTCPACGGEAPLLNSCWLAKDDEEPWAVRIITDGRKREGRVRFETYRMINGRGPNGEDPDFATVDDGVGSCIHCRQAIPEHEVKAQAQGRSDHGRWTDRLYCVAAVRFEPKLDENGRPQRYTSGERKGEIKTRKVRFFRPPNDRDLAALAAAERRLAEKWPAWEAAGLIPTEMIPEDSNYNRGHRLYGIGPLFTGDASVTVGGPEPPSWPRRQGITGRAIRSRRPAAMRALRRAPLAGAPACWWTVSSPSCKVLPSGPWPAGCCPKSIRNSSQPARREIPDTGSAMRRHRRLRSPDGSSDRSSGI